MASDQSSDQKNQIVPKYEHSDKISFRRKALFPVDNEDSNSDLGPMSPLSDTNSDVPSPNNCFASNRMDEYVLLDDSCELEDELTDISTFTNKIINTPSSINLNLTCTDSKSPFFHNRLIDKSPTMNLLTPQDTSTTNHQIPRLSRKSQSEDSEDENKSDGKVPKARTALFTEVNQVLPIPVKSFYPKVEERKPFSVKVNQKEVIKIKNEKSRSVYLCNRKRRGTGQINAGVSHKIRKQKVKNVKVTTRKVVMSLTERKQIIEYMEDLEELSKGVPKQIKPLIKQENNLNKNNINSLNLNQAINLKNKENISENIISQIIEDFDEPEIPELDNIINFLDEDLETQETDKENLPLSQNLIQNTDIKLHQPSNERKRKHEEDTTNIADMLLSPTSQMCDMTSEMAINSPKRAKLNINNILENNSHLQRRVTNVFNNKISSSTAMENKKLFPVFYKNSSNGKEVVNTVTEQKVRLSTKKWDKISPNQMILDAGQKRFGLTQCPTCEAVYHMGDPSEEREHMIFHNGTHVLKFKGWKNERVVFKDNDNRIIKILSTDSKAWLKKAKDVMDVANKEIGADLATENEDKVVYLYIKNKNIIGCVLVTPETKSYKMLSTEEGISIYSQKSYPVKCGIQLLWVLDGHRRTGIATTLLNTVRMTFLFGDVLKLEDMCLNEPTKEGKAFAVKYFNTNNYLVC